MVLLTILALGMLSLSSVSMRTSARGEANAIARANARLALMMAIGELQKEMGPDSRISAPYDAGTMPSGGQPRWTAVYDAWQRPANPTTPESPSSRTLKFRKWLTSGANQETGGPAGTGETIPLVGQQSLVPTAAPTDQINAPMHSLTAATNQGRFAWWTSDESVKAKVNAGPNSTPVSSPLSDAQSPPYIGHKAITELKSFDWKPGQRSAVVSTASTNLAAGLGTGGLGRFSHAVTVYSNGVIADVRAGLNDIA